MAQRHMHARYPTSEAAPRMAGTVAMVVDGTGGPVVQFTVPAAAAERVPLEFNNWCVLTEDYDPEMVGGREVTVACHGGTAAVSVPWPAAHVRHGAPIHVRIDAEGNLVPTAKDDSASWNGARVEERGPKYLLGTANGVLEPRARAGMMSGLTLPPLIAVLLVSGNYTKAEMVARGWM